MEPIVVTLEGATLTPERIVPKSPRVWNPLTSDTLPLEWYQDGDRCAIRIEGDIFSPTFPADKLANVLAVITLTPNHHYKTATWYPVEAVEILTCEKETYMTQQELYEETAINAAYLVSANKKPDDDEWLYDITSFTVQFPLPNLSIGLVVEPDPLREFDGYELEQFAKKLPHAAIYNCMPVDAITK